MDPTLPLNQRTLASSHVKHRQHQSSNSGNASSRLGPKPQASARSTPGHSPLPSTSQMPLSLQQLGSAASSTDSLDGPIYTQGYNTGSRARPVQLHQAGSHRSARTDSPNVPHVTVGQGSRMQAASDGTRRPSAPGTTGASVHTGDVHNRPALSPNGSAYGFKRTEPTPSIHSASSARSTSSVNSLPPASESALSASTLMFAHSDPKGKGRADLTATPPVARASKKRVPDEIEEAVRNLGLAPPGLSVQPQSSADPSYLSVPSARALAGSPHHYLSRTASTNTSAASASDAASLSGTIASSIASTSKDSQSISSKKSATSKTKKKKTKTTPSQASTTTSTIIKASSSTRSASGSVPTGSSATTTDAAGKKKKKKQPLPTSSGKPPIVSTTPSAASQALSSPQPSVRSAAARPTRSTIPATAPNKTIAPPSTTYLPASGTPASTLPRPAVQSAPSRNRHLDETALLRRFPPTSTSPVPSPVPSTQTASRLAATQGNGRSPQSVLSTSQANATASTIVPATEENVNEPAPPAWSPPQETITLAFTPIHAYLSAYHDPVDQPATIADPTTSNPPVPDSPPPAFRSRSPSPDAGSSHVRRDRPHSAASLSLDASLPDVDLDALEERSRGYASSENEVDLLTSQGRHSGTSTPPMDGAHGDSMKGLRWQLRHWEAWRREGISLEDRMQRLQQWKTATETQPASSASNSAACAPQVDSPAAQGTQEAGLSPPILVENTHSQTGTASVPHSSDDRRQERLARTDTLQTARFPSVGTVRRARLQRFEAERQHSKSMSAVVQSSPASSGVSLPRQRNVQHPPLDAIVPSTTTSTEGPGPRENIRLAMLQAALGRLPAEDAMVAVTGSTDVDKAQEGQPASEASEAYMHESISGVSASPQAESVELMQTSLAASPTHQLARQLAAEVEAKRESAACVQAITKPSIEPDNRLSTSEPAESNVSAESAAVPHASAAGDQSSSKSTADTISSPNQLQKTASRISRLFRPNMGPRLQSPRKEAVAVGHKQQLEAALSRPSSPASGGSMPVMTLPKAPPRLTTDPLSTDNLRKLSKRQLRSPSVHGAASASSSSEEELNNDSQGQSDSGSDSADDESTKKPPSTVTHLESRTQSSLLSSATHANEFDREAAAASWRRAEDGRRHSALLSRPLSIKRKPPPVPPKRWGGVWDRDAIQERLRKTFNHLDPEEQAITSGTSQSQQSTSSFGNKPSQVMPGTLATVEEDENPWPVFGQDQAPSPSTTAAHWEVVGQPAELSFSSNNLHGALIGPASPSDRQAQGSQDDEHIYSESTFSLPRQLPPALPPSARLLPPANVTVSKETETIAPSYESLWGTTAWGSSLQRVPAVRRPQSISAGQQHRQSFGSGARQPSESARASPPSFETRSRLGSRPRHVYSASVPSALSPASTPPSDFRARRPLPPLPPRPTGSSVPSTPRESESSLAVKSSVSNGSVLPAFRYHNRSTDGARPIEDISIDSDRVPTLERMEIPAPQQLHEYTDLEVMLARMDEGSVGNSSRVLREVLGVSQPATTEEIDSLPVGRVELERRRVDKKGKIKQKLSCVGINCNKCKICLEQFKEDELAVVLPVCLEVFHAEPCMRAYLATNNRCPSCQAALM